MLGSKSVITSYLVLLAAFAVTKEWIVINQELMVIFGFFTIFLTLKYLLESTITEALNEYSEQIRQKILKTLKTVSFSAQKLANNAETVSQRFSEQTNYFEYTQELFLLKIFKKKCKFLEQANTLSRKRQELIAQRLGQRKKQYYRKNFDAKNFRFLAQVQGNKKV